MPEDITPTPPVRRRAPKRVLDLSTEPITQEQKDHIVAERYREGIARNKKNLLVALEANLCNVTLACRAVRLDRSTHYTYLRKDPEYKAKVDALATVALDFAEGCLFEQMQQGSAACTIFYLKTKGRGRGYVEHRANAPEETANVNIGGGIDEQMVEEEVPEDSIDAIFTTLQEERAERQQKIKAQQDKAAEASAFVKAKAVRKIIKKKKSTK